MATITAIEVQKRRPDRVNVDLDGEFAFSLSGMLAAGLKVGAQLSPGQIASLQAGATGYLPKDSAPEEILDAIRRATSGNKYVSPHLADKLLSGVIANSNPLPHDSLSPREADVMRRVSRGETLTNIASCLHLSPKTITTYRARILEKLGVGSNAELTRYVIEHKLDV
jgi:DNA-binding NarL/FixJ family response regulator